MATPPAIKPPCESWHECRAESASAAPWAPLSPAPGVAVAALRAGQRGGRFGKGCKDPLGMPPSGIKFGLSLGLVTGPVGWRNHLRTAVSGARSWAGSPRLPDCCPSRGCGTGPERASHLPESPSILACTRGVCVPVSMCEGGSAVASAPGCQAVAPARACPPPGVQRPWTLPSTAESGPPGASMCQVCDMSPARGRVSISTKFASGGTLEWRPEF